MLTDDQRTRLGIWARDVTPRAVAFARSLVRTPEKADDIVQECLFRLLRRANDYDLERDGVKLLFKAISNLAINQATRERELVGLGNCRDDHEKAYDITDRATLRPEQVAQQRELEARIQAALQKLPPMQRAAVELRALGLSKEDIAESLGITPTNAGVMVFRGRKLLAEELRTVLDENNSKESS